MFEMIEAFVIWYNEMWIVNCKLKWDPFMDEINNRGNQMRSKW